MRNLRRSLLLAIAALAAATANGHGQTIGFKLGPSFSTLNTEETAVSWNTLTKFTGGGFLRFGMGGLAVQPELLFVTKGGKISAPAATAEAEWRLDYIEVPLLFLLPIGPGTGVAPFVYGGPAFALEVGCTVATDTPTQGGSFDCDQDPDALAPTDRRTFDVGAMIGGGLSIPMGPGALTLEGRYNFGLVNLNKDAEGGSVRNRSGAALIGYSIFIGR